MNTFRVINLINLCILTICSVYVITSYSSQEDHHRTYGADYGDTPELIESRGFKCQTHHVVTVDGYILTMFRIINPLSTHEGNHVEKEDHGKPVIMQSGLFGSSDDFLLNAPDGYIDASLMNARKSYQSIDYNEQGRTLGFLLANLGYDIWLTNFRGNYYSRNHTTLSPDSSEFWSTGWDEMATIDLPTTIDYIMKETAKDDVGYIGMSRGSGIMFALLSEKPEYALKVKPIITMAPAVYVRRKGSSYIRTFFEANMLSSYLLDHPSECFSRGIAKRMLSICSNPMVDVICSMIRQPIKSMLSERVNASRLGVYFSHYPAGSPCWDIVHFNQVGSSNTFKKLDLGESRNLVKYGQSKPPIYPLNRIKSKDLHIINSIGDKVIHPDNVVQLVDQLTVKPREWIVLNESDFSHGNFLHSKDAGTLVYREIVRILSNY